MTPVFRFAPSPNGELHLGHSRSALLNSRMAKQTGGRFLLRIEDIDPARSTAQFENGIYRDLAWLGLEWEKPVRRQSEHFAGYKTMLDRLAREDLIYPAFMSRGEIREHIAGVETARRPWPRDPDGVPVYPGVDRDLSRRERRRRIDRGDPFSWRLDTAKALARIEAQLDWIEATNETLERIDTIEAKPLDWGDVVIARRDVPTSYHLAVVTDDALQGVTHVVRGHDLYHATAIHRLLQELLGLPAPTYFHHPLVLGADDRKLSKSDGAVSLRSLREAGKTPDEVRQMVE